MHRSLCPLTIVSLGINGEGIAKTHREGGSFVYFIRGGVPGDQVLAKITEQNERFARGVVERILSPSRSRIVPPCPIFGICGGCQIQHLAYEAQVQEKQLLLKGMLQHHGRVTESVLEEPLSSPDPWFYRNKVQLAVGNASAGAAHHGSPSPGTRSGVKAVMSLGLYEEGSHRVVQMSECKIQTHLNNTVFKVLKELLPQCHWPVHDDAGQQQGLRHIMIRGSEETQQSLVVLVSSREDLPGVERFAQGLAAALPSLTTVALNHNPSQGNAVLGRDTRIVWGKGAVQERIGDLLFEISPTTFFQVNSRILPSVISLATSWLAPVDTLLDGYCGIGTFTLPFSRMVEHVTGVEEHSDSVMTGRRNLQMNQCHNVTMIHSLFERYLEEAVLEKKTFQAIFLDPPRKGIGEESARLLGSLRSQQILYLSCNPATLMRDLRAFQDSGFEVERVKLVDFFPQTSHLEVLTSLRRMIP